MRVLLSPQRTDKKIEYQFNNEVIQVTYKGITDTFDFSGFPDGVLENVETILEINPIVSAERVNGELRVVLLNFIGPDATEEERFPDWMVIE